ncbi:MAG TPA: wax ester/triacylglycerol synthase domain-containing protein [Jiangellales bacterium]|nr:wax ester/triacylglycerol synthase domain-containing protein [Jiangellales bacterium]
MREQPFAVERPGAQDLLQLAVDVGPAPMQVGVAVVLDREIPVERMLDALAARVAGAPRLRRRLVTTPPGCGRPVWMDDPSFDVRRHVRAVECPAPGDEEALLGIVATLVTRPLRRSQPLWAASVVTGLAGGRCALVVVMHHVLADGIGGLAVLAQLLDGAVEPRRDDGFPQPLPPPSRLAAEAWASRWRLLGSVPARLRDVAAGFRELGGGPPTAAPATSLNAPTGPRRRLGVARADLAAAKVAGRAAGGTVNDVVLAAVTGALGELCLSRGERLDSVVVSVPVSARRSATVRDAGNAVGAMPLTLPTRGDAPDRLRVIAAATRSRKVGRRGTSTAVLGPVFSALAGTGTFRWFIEHQRLVTTFVTNVRGPDRPVTFLGARVVDLVPVSVVPGNVTVAFTVLSYAGRLVVTLVADPDRVPELDRLTAGVQAGLDALCRPVADRTTASSAPAWAPRQ